MPAPQLGSNPAMVSRIGGAAVVCPFVLIVGLASLFPEEKFPKNVPEENCRSRSINGWNVPAIANVRVEFSERKKNLCVRKNFGGVSSSAA